MWYFDTSENTFGPQCINASLSGAPRTPVACQDAKEVRINKKWWTNAQTTNWQRLSILMHEVLLIHARLSYTSANSSESPKIDGEKAVHAINARMFALIALDKTSANYEQELAQAKSTFVNELNSEIPFVQNIILHFPAGIGTIKFSPEVKAADGVAHQTDSFEKLRDISELKTENLFSLFDISPLLLSKKNIIEGKTKNEELFFKNASSMVACNYDKICNYKIMKELIKDGLNLAFMSKYDPQADLSAYANPFMPFVGVIADYCPGLYGHFFWRFNPLRVFQLVKPDSNFQKEDLVWSSDAEGLDRIDCKTPALLNAVKSGRFAIQINELAQKEYAKEGLVTSAILDALYVPAMIKEFVP